MKLPRFLSTRPVSPGGKRRSPAPGTLRFEALEPRKMLAVGPIEMPGAEQPENTIPDTPPAQVVADWNSSSPSPVRMAMTAGGFASPTYPTFENATGLELNGSARLTNNGRLRLTKLESSQAGSAWYQDVLSLDSDTSFQTGFSFSISGGDRRDGAEGIAFVLQNSAAGDTALGPAGSGLGYAGIENSVAVEFDTSLSSGESSQNHVSLVAGGQIGSPLQTAALPFNLNSGNIIYAWVDYDSILNEMTVRIAESNVKPALPLLAINIDLESVVGNQARPGFSASTGTLINKHDIRSWELTENLGGGGNAGVISLASSVINVSEDDGFANVAIVRSGGSTGEVTVDYRTFADTADPVLDYTDVSGRLTFDDGQSLQFVQIPLQDNLEGEPEESLSLTIDNVLGGATLLAPRTATIIITDDDFLLPHYPTFDNTADVDLNGSARITRNGRLRLTKITPSQAGSAWYRDALPLNANTSFQTSFAFSISGGDRRDGGHGMAFVIQNSAAGAAALGAIGEGLGYSGIENSLAVEFDTFAGPGDVNENHLSLVIDGQTLNPLETAVLPLDLNQGSVLHAWVDYNGLLDQLAVYVSETASKPAEPIIHTNLNLLQIVGDEGWLGFTAATGTLRNKHDIRSWDLNLNVPPAIEPPGPGDTLQRVTVQAGFNQPTSIAWSPDGQNLYIAEKSGIVTVVRNGVRQTPPFIDISTQVNDVRDRGLLDIAVHPDFQNNPYVYLLFTYDPPEVYQNASHPLAGPDQTGNRAGRLIRVTANAGADYTTAIANSEVVLLGTNSTWDNFNAFANSTTNFAEPPAGILPDGSSVRDFIASDSESHSVGGLDFGPDGALYVSTGDGASYNQVDRRAIRVQDIDNLSGKVLRINPVSGAGLTDNPFYNGDNQANRSKVYQYGLRNPFRISVDPVTGAVYVGDVGWSNWEEINTSGPGANFGWPFYEGTIGTNNPTTGYRNLPEAIAFYNSGQTAMPPYYALNHAADGINAIILGDVYYGNNYPLAYVGDLFFNDLGQGIVRNLSFNNDGTVASVQTFATGAEIVVQIREAPDGYLYYVDLDDGLIGRWEFV